MTDGETFRRKLSAILSADVNGYSRLMQTDEADTVRILSAHKKIMDELIQQHRGRVVDAPGDNLLAEFTSVVDAVACALEVQRELDRRNGLLLDDRRMAFRIGINLGDVIEEDGKIYGDGVNIAARLEALADPGGICISKAVFDQIGTKLQLRCEYIGEQAVKNIARPIGVYRVLMDPAVTRPQQGEGLRRNGKGLGRRSYILLFVAACVLAVGFAVAWRFLLRPSPPQGEPADTLKLAFPLPDKPSIAVLPFANVSHDPKQEFFGDGLAEEIINALTKLPQVFVIARNSSFRYKGETVDIKQVGRELGVKYVLEGSVRWEGERIRVTAQLVDAATGNHVFSERYDREMREIFATQDEITLKVLTAMQVVLTEGEQARVQAKGAGSLEAFMKFLEGREHILRSNREGNNQARGLLEEAIALSPTWAMPYSALALTDYYDALLGWSPTPQESIERGMELAQKAIALDDSVACGHAVFSLFLIMTKEFDEAVAQGEKAVELEPSSTTAHECLGTALLHASRPKEAIPVFRKSLRLSPHPSLLVLQNLATSFRNAGEYEEAVATYKQLIQRSPDHLLGHLGLAATYSLMGREEEARRETSEVLRVDPKFSLQSYANGLQYKNETERDRCIEALRKAGLK